MNVDNFSVIEEIFHKRIEKIVWCTFATVDTQGRPRTRILHPIWQGHEGWVATGRHSLKAKHLANNAYVSLCYWDPDHEQVYIDCKAEWDDDPASKQSIWDLYKNTPEPLGYDPSIIWQGPEDANFGLLKLRPWRIEVSSLKDAKNSQVWHQDSG